MELVLKAEGEPRDAFVYICDDTNVPLQNWTIHKCKIPDEAHYLLLYQLVHFLRGCETNPASKPPEVQPGLYKDDKYKWYDLSWYGIQENWTRRFVTLCTVDSICGEGEGYKSLKELAIVDFSDVQLDFRQLANIGRLTGLSVLNPWDAFDPNFAGLPIIDGPNYTHGTGSEIQRAAHKDFLDSWKKHPIFAVRPVESLVVDGDEEKRVIHSAIDVFNRHSGMIDARIEFLPTGVYVVDPIIMDGRDEDQAPRVYLQTIEYSEPTLNDY